MTKKLIFTLFYLAVIFSLTILPSKARPDPVRLDFDTYPESPWYNQANGGSAYASEEILTDLYYNCYEIAS